MLLQWNLVARDSIWERIEWREVPGPARSRHSNRIAAKSQSDLLFFRLRYRVKASVGAVTKITLATLLYITCVIGLLRGFERVLYMTHI